MTTQAPHIIRAAVALVAELPEHMIRIVSPDLGGGFGNKVPVYPGYVMSILASILTERPVKWIEDKTGNLISTGFGRDIYLHGEMALRRDGRILGVRMHTDSDHGAFFSDAQPSKFKIGLMHSAFACYDIPAAHLTARGVYTNKAPGGVAYRCSFRVTEAMFFQERMVQAAADDLGMDQAEFRRLNFVRDDDFPHRTPFGFLTDSGQYGKCLDVGSGGHRLPGLPAPQGGGPGEGALLGIGISTMTEPLGAGNSREYDILGIKMFDSAELRVHMTGKAMLRTGAKTQGQGHETTWAQIVTHELGIPAEDIVVEEGDTDTAPFGMGTYASRSTPVAGAAVAMVSRKVRAKARKIAAHLLEVSEEDVEWELGRFYVRSAPDRGVTIQECAMAAYSNMPDGMEPGLENNAYYDPPNLTWPFGCYITTVEVDPQTGVWDVLQVVAVDDCGVRINPMIVEGQIMGGLTEAYAMASMQFITFDAQGNCVGSNYMDYLLPTAWETPGFELHEVVTPCPHHPIGAKGVGECATVGGPAAFVNAVIDALKGTGVRNIDMPLLPDRVYEALTTAARRVGGAAGQDGRRWLSRHPRTRTFPGRAPSPAGRSSSAPRRWPGRARSSPSPRWCGGWARRPASRGRGRSSPPTGSCSAGSAGRARSRSCSARRSARSSSGESRLLLLGTPEQFGGAVPDGIRVIPIACSSEGALEVFVEPVIPVPSVLVVGRSPMAQTLADLVTRPGLAQPARRLAGVHRGPGRRPLDRRGRHPGARRRGGARAGGARPAGVPRAGRLPTARRDRARLPGRPRHPGRRARARARTGRPRPRPHRAPRDRGRHPRGARAAARDGGAAAGPPRPG